MNASPSTLPALLADLRTALEADAQAARAHLSGAVEAMLLTLIAQFVTRLGTLAHAWHQGDLTRATTGTNARPERLPFHLRLRESRRARTLSRASRGRRRIATWRAANRGASALPSHTRTPARAIAARAPPQPAVA